MLKVGIFYYVWYGPGRRHWGPPGHPHWSVLDYPLLGYYNSASPCVIRQHVEWIKNLGVHFLIVSWWGPFSFEDKVAEKLFPRLKGLEACILVEPATGQDPGTYDRRWWRTVMEWLNTRYLKRKEYFKWMGKPLLAAFAPVGLAYDPSEDYPVTFRVVGKDWDLWPDYDRELTGSLRVRKDRCVTVCPRFDDTHFRTPGQAFDKDLKVTWFGKQAEWVKENKHRIRLVLIYSWNEFHERSQIEPHKGPGHPFYYTLYNRARDYIKMWR